MKSRVVFSSDKLGVFVWPSESVDKFEWLLLILLPDCCCCRCCKCWDSWLPGATPRSVFFSSIGGSPAPQLDVELSSGLSWANPLCAWHDRNQNLLLILLARTLSLSLSTSLFLLLAIASKRAQYSGSPRTVWSLRPDVIERETKKATSAREYPKLLLLSL